MHPKLLKFATFYPLFYLVFFFIFAFILIILAQLTQNSPFIMVLFIIGLILHLFAMVDIVFVYIYYLMNIFKNPAVPPQEHTKWFLLIFFFNIIAIPFYWNKFIKPTSPSAQPTSSTQLPPQPIPPTPIAQ